MAQTDVGIQKKGRIPKLGAGCAIALLLVIAAVLFPVFADTSPGNPKGVILDSLRQPISGITLRLHKGNEVREVTIDALGRFEFPWKRRLSDGVWIEDYVLLQHRRSTGGAGSFVYSAAGTLHVRCADESGAPVMCDLNIGFANQQLRLPRTQADFKIDDVPLAIGDITVTPVDLRKRLVRYERKAEGAGVLVTAIFTEQAKPFPRRTPMSYDGHKVHFHGW